jgi:glycosyltransferase involved in cell wall biosynthesis
MKETKLSLRIAILGTKGIPNNYGGFEQFAEYLSKGLVQRGHQVTVYNPHFHPYKADMLHGVKIRRMYSPEKSIGSAANYIYDFICLRHAVKQHYDIIYEAGYGSAAFSYLFFSFSNTTLVTNMDGLEWKRAKWNKLIQWVTKLSEKIAIKKSHHLISDNIGIQEYYRSEHNAKSFYLPYGATPVEHFDESILAKYGLVKGKFYLLIARIEPENNIEMVVTAFNNLLSEEQLIIIGNINNKFSKRIVESAKSNSSIKFLGGIYDKSHLDSLRHYSKAYIHGHSVGGTNPSLLEAMACESFIIAHDNNFNKGVLGENAFYFNSEENLRKIINSFSQDEYKLQSRKANKKIIMENYNWEKIIQDHEVFFSSIVDRNR